MKLENTDALKVLLDASKKQLDELEPRAKDGKVELHALPEALQAVAKESSALSKEKVKAGYGGTRDAAMVDLAQLRKFIGRAEQKMSMPEGHGLGAAVGDLGAQLGKFLGLVASQRPDASVPTSGSGVKIDPLAKELGRVLTDRLPKDVRKGDLTPGFLGNNNRAMLTRAVWTSLAQDLGAKVYSDSYGTHTTPPVNNSYGTIVPGGSSDPTTLKTLDKGIRNVALEAGFAQAGAHLARVLDALPPGASFAVVHEELFRNDGLVPKNWQSAAASLHTVIKADLHGA